jgi:hypothetical protein
VQVVLLVLVLWQPLNIARHRAELPDPLAAHFAADGTPAVRPPPRPAARAPPGRAALSRRRGVAADPGLPALPAGDNAGDRAAGAGLRRARAGCPAALPCPALPRLCAPRLARTGRAPRRAAPGEARHGR